MNAYPYLRVSGESQISGDGFERQLESCRNFIRATPELNLCASTREEGVSGTVQDRPAFTELLATVEAPAVIVVERLDRLARDLMVQEFLLRECRERNIKVYAADQGAIDLASNDLDPTRKLIRQVLGALAEWEKSALVKKLYEARKRTGHWGGPPKYGATEGEKRILHLIISLRKQGFGYKSVASQLNAAGFTTRKGKQWCKEYVRNALCEAAIVSNSCPKSQTGPTQ